MNITAIITAGGSSQRFGNSNKLLEVLCEKTVIERTVEAFLAVSEINSIIISVNESILDEISNLFSLIPTIRIVKGGATRQESVYNALLACSDADYVLIHDGARPLVSHKVIMDTISTVLLKNALTVAVKTVDTIKKVDSENKIIQTLNREMLFNTQTPQAFKYELILSAHQKLIGKNFTDDAGMLESLGYDVYILEGEYKNLKITTQVDLQIARALC